MSDYDCISGGALKLKGASASGIKRKKVRSKDREIDLNVKKQKKVLVDEEETDKEKDVAIQRKRTARRQSSSSSSCWDLESSNSEQHSEIKDADDRMAIIRKTNAQLAFEKMQEKRQMQKILEKASKTHKQRVEEFNRHLDSLTEHYDIPKVSWTK